MKQRTDPNTWLTVIVNDVVIDQHVDQFPDGSFRWNLTSLVEVDEVEVTITLKTTLPEAMVGLYQAMTALGAFYEGKCIESTLVVNTLPDQRADRVETLGMSLPARATAVILANTYVDKIIVHEAHSPFILNELRKFHPNVEEIKGSTLFALELPTWSNREPTHIVAVDAGSVQRAEDTAALYGASVIYMDKVRTEGKVVGHKITDWDRSKTPTHESIIWIVYDLCDGGATFLSAAHALFNRFDYEELNLFVTHGLFSKGKEELNKYFTHVIGYFDYAE